MGLFYGSLLYDSFRMSVFVYCGSHLTYVAYLQAVVCLTLLGKS